MHACIVACREQLNNVQEAPSNGAESSKTGGTLVSHLPMVTWNTPEWRLANGIDRPAKPPRSPRKSRAKPPRPPRTRQVDVPGYSSYCSMLKRCSNPNCDSYEYYGGRGITVCERWRGSFDNFIADMGPRPSSRHSIERNDTNGNYEPGNCRWATDKEQHRNKRSNRHVAAFGETKPVSAWVEDCRSVVSKETIKDRLNRGWDAEAALTTPTAPHYRQRKRHNAQPEPAAISS